MSDNTVKPTRVAPAQPRWERETFETVNTPRAVSAKPYALAASVWVLLLITHFIAGGIGILIGVNSQ